MPLVTRPVDTLVQLDNFVTAVDSNVREFFYAGIGNIIVAPSSYKLRAGDAIGIKVSTIHPAWYYSAMNYNDEHLSLYGKYQHYRTDMGVEANISVPNTKRSSMAQSHAGVVDPTTSSYQMMDDIPVHYYGKAVAKKKPSEPGYNTFLTSIIDNDKIKVTRLSAWEYEIEVLQNLTEEQWFYLPDACAKGLPNTIWGKVGTESTLPKGASCGLIKVRSEAMLDAKSGCYLLTGKQLEAITAPTTTIYENSYVDKTGGHPSWILNFLETTIPGLEQYQTIQEIVEAGNPYFACGYKMGCCTVGTGIFVRNGSEVATIPFGQTTNGISYKRREVQNQDAPKEKYTMGEMLDCEDFFETIAKSGNGTEKLPVGVIIPLCASELQIDSKEPDPSPYQAPICAQYKYSYPVEGTSLPVAVTPTYIPSASTITCYMPRLQNSTSTIVNMLQVNGLDDTVTAFLYPQQSWLQIGTGNIASAIRPMSAMNYASNDNPTGGLDRDKFGFTQTHSYSEYTPSWSYTVRYQGRGKAVWNNPSIDPTIGSDASPTEYINNVLISGIIMAFVGVFPAGTEKGTYLWKPFESVQTATGCLMSLDAEYISAPAVASLKPETTSVPYIGLNIVTAESSGLNWSTELIAGDNDYYKFWQVLQNVSYNNEKTFKIMDTRFMTINVDEVATVGYPIAERPMLIDIDDWSGDKACDIGDLVVTGPIFDKETHEWEVIAASILLKKLYRIDVEVSEEGNYVTKFLRVRDSKELFDTPYGQFSEILGLAYTTDIHYLEKPRVVEEMNEYAADVLFLVDDSIGMAALIDVLKDNIDDLLLRFEDKGIRHIKVGAAVYDITQKALSLPGTEDTYWANDIDKASELVKTIAPQLTGSTEYASHHWSALSWAVDNYEWDKNYRVKHIILVTNTDYENDSILEGTAQNKLKAAKINLDVITDKVRYFSSIVTETDGIVLDSGSGENWGPSMVEHIGDYISNAVDYAYRVIAEEGAIVFYGITEEEVSTNTKGTNLVVGTFRTNMEWDVNKDTICRIRMNGPNQENYQISKDINLPRGVAVMYPYVYVLGYTWVSMPTQPVVDPIVSSTMPLTGSGWQMALWRMDVTSGLGNDAIQVQDATDMRFTFGIPAKDKDAAQLWRDDKVKLGGVMKYTWGTTQPNILPASQSLPLRSKSYENPAIAGIFAASGQLIAFSNYLEKIVAINPITGCIEELGTNIFPFTYPYNHNTCASGDVISTVSRFGGRNYYTAHPFFHICIGDGLIPNKYGSGIDIQDITKGQSLLRTCKLKNNLLRDSLYDVYLIVPEPEKLPGSDMLWLSLTGNEADKSKSIRIPGPVLPCETVTFYIHITPELKEMESYLILYVNSRFSRVTVFFGYRNRMGEAE